MNIEDVKVGTKVRVISTETTDNYSIYDGSKMLGVGGVSVVNRIEGKIVLLRDGHWYAVKDLQLYEKLPKVAVPEKEIAKLIVSISDAIDSLELNNTESSSMQTDTNVVTEDSILTNLLNLIEKATACGDLESLLNLTTAYQRMKSASTI